MLESVWKNFRMNGFYTANRQNQHASCIETVGLYIFVDNVNHRYICVVSWAGLAVSVDKVVFNTVKGR